MVLRLFIVPSAFLKEIENPFCTGDQVFSYDPEMAVEGRFEMLGVVADRRGFFSGNERSGFRVRQGDEFDDQVFFCQLVKVVGDKPERDILPQTQVVDQREGRNEVRGGAAGEGSAFGIAETACRRGMSKVNAKREDIGAMFEIELVDT